MLSFQPHPPSFKNTGYRPVKKGRPHIPNFLRFSYTYHALMARGFTSQFVK